MYSVEVLKKYFGYETFREGQESLISGILGGMDVLGIMPTGAGKSICFQVPAMIMEGVTIVVSPLISLMKDQVNSLSQAGVPGAYINSSLTEGQIDIVIERAKNGRYKLIYIAPERLASPKFLAFAKGANISMVTVDEAHCISQWGQDFRPSYAKIPEFIELLDKRPIVAAFTATATQKVREDILELLKLNNPQVLVTGFDRANLFFEVQRPSDKLGALRDILEERKGKFGIVYCSTRKAVEEVCACINSYGYAASYYHAGLSDVERHKSQDDFLFDRVSIMVATNAFGMGIDKSNVSFVVHYNMPKDMESYYQEAGRAGRDGEAADCFLLYSGQDVWTNSWLIDNAKDMEYADLETEILLKESSRKRLKEMTFYCSTNECLRAYILRYFGEKPTNYCGNCSNCNTNFETEDITIEAQKIVSCVFRAGQRFGVNMIVDILRGSKNQRIMDFALDKLSTYGISELSDGKLKDMLNHLILEGFLVKTDDKYPVIKLGYRAQDLLKGEEIVVMKLVKEDARVKSVSKSKFKKIAIIKDIDEGLFNKLRTLRGEIAKSQGVPAFVVFADSALSDMCAKLPTIEAEFLDVSGVGKAKLERYGDKFLTVIREYLDK